MADNAQKIPFQRSLTATAIKRATDAIQLTGKALPCSVVSVDSDVGGVIVTVQFELDQNIPFTLPQITIPVASPNYIRLPIQPGDLGVTMAADVRLGGISGLGSGQAPLVSPANLTALFFVPIGNLNWDPPVDKDKLQLQGPQGVVIKKMGGTAVVTVEDDKITMQTSGASMTITSSEVNIVGTLNINGSAYLAHRHSGVQTGGGTSGGVVP